MKMVVLFVLLCSICVSGVSLGNTTLLYSESFASGKSLADLGFTGKEPTYWVLDTSGRYMRSVTPDKILCEFSEIYTPSFEADRNKGPVVVEWKLNYQQEKSKKCLIEGKVTTVSLTDSKGKELYSLVFIPNFERHPLMMTSLLLMRYDRLIPKFIDEKFSSAIVPVGKWITMRMELEPTSGGEGRIKVLGDFGDGRGFVTLINAKDKHYSSFAKLHFKYGLGIGRRKYEVAVDDIRVFGAAGNKDNTPPVTTHDYLNNGVWVKEPVQINLTATDDASGVAATYYKVNDGEVVEGNTLSFTAEGIYTVDYWSVDKAGNTETAKKLKVKIDQSGPVVEPALSPAPNAGGWNNADVMITFNAYDAFSGVDQVSEAVQVTAEGEQVISYTATDKVGNETTGTVTVKLDKTAPSIFSLQPADGSIHTTARPSISAVFMDGLSGIDPDSVRLTLDGRIVKGATVTATGLSYTPSADLGAGRHTISLSLSDMAGNKAVPVSATFTIDSTLPLLPPDPATVAPELNITEFTPVSKAVEFLYTGDNPIQTGMDQETIDPVRAAVIRGKVLNKYNQPLPAVTISVLNHPEYGQTITRADGMFDMVVNGGEQLTIKYVCDGYLQSQRQVKVAWDGYTILPDVVLIEEDPNVTPIQMGVQQVQVARGSVISDQDGVRQATLIFPENVRAIGVSGKTLNIRATEYTVGDNGHLAMPAELPANIGYTYCVELSADGLSSVRFNKEIYFYVENFLNFPVGGIVPIGYYDRNKGIWVPSENGRVIKIVGITDGKADLDVDGNGIASPERLLELNISDSEREKLATLYNVGQSLWRSPITHFTPWDCNWPYGPPAGAKAPALPQPKTGSNPDDNCYKHNASSIQIQSQVLGEEVPLAGTPFSIHYSSDRVPGYRGSSVLELKVFDDQIPTGVKRAELTIEVAGRTFTQSFAPQVNCWATFMWDGKDAYGRDVIGMQKAKVTRSYIYDGVYMTPLELERAFGELSGVPMLGIRARQEIALSQVSEAYIAGINALKPTIAGWSVDINHFYDPKAGILYLGNGERRSATQMPMVMQTVAGGGTRQLQEGCPAKDVAFDTIQGMSVGPDGSIYMALKHSIWKIDGDGLLRIIAGGEQKGFSGDGGAAINALLDTPCLLTFGNNDTLYFYDSGNFRIRYIDREGHINTFASEVYIEPQNGKIAIAPDGSIYSLSGLGEPIYRYNTSGARTVFAQTSNEDLYDNFDGKSVNEVTFHRINAMSVGGDGSVYLAREYTVWKITPDGIVRFVTGNKKETYWYGPQNTGDGGPAIDAQIHCITDLHATSNGDLYITCGGLINWASPSWAPKTTHFNHIRLITTDGIIHTLAGPNNTVGFDGNGGPAKQAIMNVPTDIKVGPDGSIYFVDSKNKQIREIRLAFAGFNNDDILVVSEDGGELYRFSSAGKHLQTIDTLTNQTIYSFDYDSTGNLVSITDLNGNVTRIERNSNGEPTAVIAPFGQMTRFNVSADGFLESVINPAGETVRMVYGDGGLLEEFIDSRGGSHRFFYDEMGRLVRDQDPVGRVVKLTRTSTENGFMVTEETDLDDETVITNTYLTEYLASGETRLTNQGCCGGPIVTIIGLDGTKKITRPDGTVVTTVEGADPRFGLQAPILKEITIQTPNGLTYVQKNTRSVTLNNPNNLMGLATQTDIIEINGKQATIVYDAATRRVTRKSPSGRQTVTTLDEKGRIIRTETPGFAPVRFEYDERGRLIKIYHGTGLNDRISSIQYNSNGYVQSMTDPLNRTTSFEYDAVGRITRQVLPNGKQISFTYDANGNITTLTPPGRPSHEFTYTAVNMEDTYNPPTVTGTGTNRTKYKYNLNRQITIVNRPDGKSIGFEYDTMGRLMSVVLPDGEIAYSYDPDNSNLINVIAPDNGTITYAYDGSLPTKATWAGTIRGSVEVTYDNFFRVDSQKVNGGNTVTFGYDNDGLLTQAGSLTLSHDQQNGLLTGTSIGNVTDTYQYNEFGEVSQYRATFGGTILLATSYTMDKLGRISSKTETFNGQTHTYVYTYDAVGQLTEVRKDGILISRYEYDANGNRISYSGLNGSVSASYDNQDRMLRYGENTYKYSANGELQEKTNAEGTTYYNYDVLGNLKAVTLPDGTNIQYVIDGANRRIGRKVNGVLVQGFLYQDQLNPVAELDGSGNVVSRFVYANGINVPDYFIKGGVTYRIITDHLGSPRVIINVATGEIVQRMDYDEFGKVILDTNPGFQPFGFAGGLYDPMTGLVRFGGRDYDPEVGRWTAKDPIGFLGGDTDLYCYVGNDPVNYIDLDGLARGDWWDLRTYLPDLKGAREIAEEVLREAQNTGLPGLHNGEADAWRHAQWNKRMVEELGWLTAVIAGYGHELEGAFKGQPWNEFWMDLHNNREGRRIANKKDSCGNDITPWNLINEGRLRTINPPNRGSGWLY